MPDSVLVLYAHPAPHRSRANAALVAAARRVPGVRVHDLYEVYPDLIVDVRREQDLLAAHRSVVFQHPLFWYSTPALLKEWTDQVLTHGWAYGEGGTALAGKDWLTACTTGGSAAAYTPEGSHGISLRALLAPLAQTARLCRMRFVPPLAVQGTFQLSEQQLATAASRYARVLAALRDGTLDVHATTPDGLLDPVRAAPEPS